ncbi:MAG TPA: isocitrate lyase/phosphoenolpyruvate mutase family protein [Solirubrobacterales bacterium]|nr:isocitrate lyase/phosphoenolpyruvate mutase family protein [Solirubrobacterales bacterium]
MAASQAERGETFRSLHEGEPFVIPNPWDAGAAKMLAGVGFKALATTSSGFAFTLGRLDGAVTLDEVADHVALLSDATDLPLSVDLENGYGPSPDDAARAIALVAEAGAVGGSIEDWDRDEGVIYERERAAERIAAAAEAAASLDFPFTLTGRAENFVRDHPDLDDTIARLQAYGDAGADVLFAPGLRKVEDIRTVCDAVSKPVNVLGSPRLGLTIDEIFEAGAQRISVGGGLAWAAVDAAIVVAEQIADDGDLSGLGTPGRVQEWLRR